MMAHYCLSPMGIEEILNSPRRVRRQRIQFAAWCARQMCTRYGMLPIYLTPPLTLLLALQAVPDMSPWISQGGFAVLAIYMIYRHERLMNSALKAQADADGQHAARMKELLDAGMERERKLVTVIEANGVLQGRLLESIDRLVGAVDHLVETRACPFDGDEHPARRRN